MSRRIFSKSVGSLILYENYTFGKGGGVLESRISSPYPGAKQVAPPATKDEREYRTRSPPRRNRRSGAVANHRGWVRRRKASYSEYAETLSWSYVLEPSALEPQRPSISSLTTESTKSYCIPVASNYRFSSTYAACPCDPLLCSLFSLLLFFSFIFFRCARSSFRCDARSSRLF